MRTRHAALVALTIGLAFAATGCRGDERPFRIGVLTDCVGIYRALDDAELSGAQLPLIERGARLRGRRPGEGISDVRVAGRRVELVRACSETIEFSTVFEQARRLVEAKHVDALVAGTLGVDGLGLREVARRYPDVPFVATPTGTREVTLSARPPNLFRVAPDHGQTVAGLASYAYDRLGWRTAAVVGLNWDIGWGETAAFVAEFCSRGGRVRQVRLDFLDPAGADAARVPKDVDGVAVLTNAVLGPQSEFMRQLARRVGDPRTRLVLGPYVTSDQSALRAVGGRLQGVVGSALYPPASASPGMRRHVRSYADAFPGLSHDLAQSELVVAYRSAVEAVVVAFEQAGGELGEGRQRLLSELAGLEADLAGQHIRLDENGQAVTSATIVRLGRPVDGTTPRLVPVRSIPDVDQSVGGLLRADLRPGGYDAPCRRMQPPVWAG